MDHRRRIPLVAILAIVTGMVLPASPVLAAPGLVVTPSSGVVGATLNASATGFPPGGPVTFWWDATAILLGTKTAGSGGGAALAFKIPAGASLGGHTVRACAGSFCPDGTPLPHADDTVTVVAKATPAPTRPRPTATPRPTPKPKPTQTTAPTSTATATPPPPSHPSLPSAGPTGGVVAPSFPLSGGPTIAPTPYPQLVATLLPQPPDDLAASPGPFPDLDILAMEVTQGIQDLNNNMPLVADRRTYVRVYLDVIGQNELAHTYGALEARRNGQQLGWIWPENGPITATANGGNRLDLDDSLYFRLPAAWLDGIVTLTAFVYSHDVTFPWTKEPSAANNFEQETVSFLEAEPLNLHLVTIHLHRSFHPTDIVREYVPNVGGNQFASEGGLDFSRILAGFWRYHPISDLAYDVFPVSIYPQDHGAGDEWDLGPCATTVAEPDDQYPGLMLTSWGPFMEAEGLAFQEGALVNPDREDLVILDRRYTVDYFYVRSGGRAQVFGSHDGVGPDPIVGAPAMVGGCPNPGDESGEPNSTVALLRAWYDWADSREFFVSMIDPILPTKWGGLASSLDTAWVKMNPNTSHTSWYFRGSATMAHEAAHLTGLNHVACKDDDNDGVADEIAGGPIDPTHPQQLRFPECSLAEVRDYGYYGFDVYFDAYGLAAPVVISNDPNAPVENRAYPMLSYEAPRWTDPYHYCLMLNYYGVACDADGLDEPWVPPTGEMPDAFWQPKPGDDAPAPDPGVPLLLLSGEIPADGSPATLEGLGAIHDPSQALLTQLALQDQLPESAVRGRLVARDAAGTVVVDIPIPVEPLDDAHGHGDADPLRFDLLLPLDPAIAEIGVEVGGQPVAALAVSASAPTAAWTSLQAGPDADLPLLGPETVIAFEAADADGDEATATLVYSPDGEHWQVVATAVESGFALGEAASVLPGSDDGILRLVVSDGIHTAIAANEPRVRVANRPPIVHIDSPTLLLTLPMGAEVVLTGSAFDREDRRLPDEAFEWTSSIDGPIGTGREVRTRSLSPGRHLLTLVVTDGDGAAADAAIELIVDGTRTAPRAGDELTAAVAGLFEQLGAGEEPTVPSPPATAPTTTGFEALAVIAAIAVVAALVGLGALLLRRRGGAVRPG